MYKTRFAHLSVAVAMASLVTGCAWDRMDHADKGTAVGGTTGAVAGAVVGGPVDAAAGAGGGAYAGNQVGSSDANSRTPAAQENYRQFDSSMVREVQTALQDKGFSPGKIDGQWGASTANAVTRFQEANALPPTGDPDARTLAELGVDTTPTRTSSYSKRSK